MKCGLMAPKMKLDNKVTFCYRGGVLDALIFKSSKIELWMYGAYYEVDIQSTILPIGGSFESQF